MLSKALARFLELPLTLHPIMAPSLVQREPKDPAGHKADNVPPELALIATVVIALKLIYGLDGRDVCVRSFIGRSFTIYEQD